MTRTDANSSFGTMLTAVALTSPGRGALRRPSYDAGPEMVVRPRGWRWFARAVDALLTWHERVRQRRQLLRMDDHMLRDIGISRSEAFGEAEKPFWRA
jgi:uncharacterized protein YjiS (DUF1127 family)